MEASKRLLNLPGHKLRVFRVGETDMIGVCYDGADIKEGIMRVGEYGIGVSFEEACQDYLNKISGKTIIFGYGDEREEIKVL